MQFEEKKLFQRALILSIITIVYNLIEGLVSTYFGWKDETLTLFGFGADSFVETISALGVTQMIFRLKTNPISERGRLEVIALRITGYCFYALAVFLALTAINNIYTGQEPESTKVGVIVAAISILCMWLLIQAKISVGKRLDSAPIIADARCNQVCLYMSLILLVSSSLWFFLKVPYIDVLGTIGIIYYSYNEGKEAFQKAKGIAECHCNH